MNNINKTKTGTHRQHNARMGELQDTIRKRTHANIPTQQEKTNPTETEWITKLEQWGAEQEIYQLDNAYKKRTELQQEIPRRNKK